MSGFKRGLSEGFISRLNEEADRRSWWTDVLNDPELYIGIRDEKLNVYWRGHSLFLADYMESEFGVSTHVKYLLDPDLSDQIPLVEGKFDFRRLGKRGLISQYEGPETLGKMKRAADLFSEPEKKGCHEVILTNSHVIDCEIAFPDSGGAEKGAIRVDLLSLEPDGQLVFWEAKHFGNGDLRADDDKVVPVCEQIHSYQKYLSNPEHGSLVEASYWQVAKNLIAIQEMGWKRPLSPLLKEVAEDKLMLKLGAEPQVGLVVFGFDKAQRDDLAWKERHLARLKKEIKHVVAAGDAANIKLRL